jgi:hypothetical protein
MHSQITNYFFLSNELFHYSNSFGLRCNYFIHRNAKVQQTKIFAHNCEFSALFFNRSVLKRRTKTFRQLNPFPSSHKKVEETLSWVQHKQPCLMTGKRSFLQTQLSICRHILSREGGNIPVLDTLSSVLITR